MNKKFHLKECYLIELSNGECIYRDYYPTDKFFVDFKNKKHKVKRVIKMQEVTEKSKSNRKLEIENMIFYLQENTRQLVDEWIKLK